MSRKASSAAADLAMDPDKAARVAVELNRLEELFTGADDNQRAFIQREIEKLAWLNISIIDLQLDIDKNGAVIPYQNGQTQKGLQANPACKLLIEYQKLANTTFRALLPVLPLESSGPGKLNKFLHDLDIDNV